MRRYKVRQREIEKPKDKRGEERKRKNSRNSHKEIRMQSGKRKKERIRSLNKKIRRWIVGEDSEKKSESREGKIVRRRREGAMNRANETSE